MTAYFSVKNFEKYQHYKDRDPVWIKLYNKLLDNYEFGQLPDATKWHLIGIFLLASRYQNRIPLDLKWLQGKLLATTPIDLVSIHKADFIVLDQDCSNLLASGYQNACLETEREKEKDTSSLRSEDADGVDEHDDDQTDIWKNPLRWLVKASSLPEAKARSIMGKWAKQYGNEVVLEAMRSARSSRDGPVDPVSWVTKILQEIGHDSEETAEAKERRSAERVKGVVARIRGQPG